MSAASPHIVLLEDDPAIAEAVAYALQREGWACTQVLLVAEAERLLLAPRQPAPFSAAILDVGLPDGNGLGLCRRLRAAPATLALPILMLTARSEEMDRVLGLEGGADDYLTKPFSPRELVARLRALLRRTALGNAASAAAVGGLWQVDGAGQRIAYAGSWLVLTRLEFGLLSALARTPGRVQSRDALMAAVWGDSAEASDRTIDTHIKTLRAKLRAVREGGEADILTHRGMGYSVRANMTPH